MVVPGCVDSRRPAGTGYDGDATFVTDPADRADARVRAGAAKYAQLGIPFALADASTPSRELVVSVRERMTAAGLTVF